MNDGTVALVLAAGAGSRFHGQKLVRSVAGRPVLQHVLDTLADAALDEVIVVLGRDAVVVEAAIDWRTERRVVNPAPDRGLSSSLRLGLASIGPDPTAVLVVLGDQPMLAATTIVALLSVEPDDTHPIVVPNYADDQGRNPVLVGRSAFGLVDEATGDRGLGPVIAAHPGRVREVPVRGDNPDVDTNEDLARVADSMWAARVQANRDQVELIREVPDGTDFYAPVRSMFRADPMRAGDPVLAALLDHVRSGDRWLDVGAGAGRYALPIARALDGSGGDVIALDPSPSMLEALREIADDHAIENIRTVEVRWPPSDGSAAAAIEADVVLIAHVGYDIEAIGPFVDALESASRRRCIAVLMRQVPASAADPFWPPVHEQARSALPALADFVDLLRARGAAADVRMLESESRRFESRDALAGFVRRQLWIDPDGPKEARLQTALDDLSTELTDGWTVVGHETVSVGIVSWAPRR